MRTGIIVIAILASACAAPSPPSAPSTPMATPPPLGTGASAPASHAPTAARDVGPASTADVAFDPAPSGAFAGAPGNVPGDFGITGIAACGDRVIAVGNGFALRSSDRGLRFSRVSVPVRFPVVACATPNDFYLAGEEAVFRSTDGGASFSQVAKAPGAVSGIWAKSAAEIYIVGGGGAPFVARSTDHGSTFSVLVTPVKDGWLYGLTTTDGNDVIAVGKESTKAGDDDAVVLRSTDSGKTFSRLRVFKKEGAHEQGRQACFASGVLFVSSAYSLHMTSDLGKSWKRATKVGAEVLALACRGAQVMVGGRNRALLVSSDLGATWKSDALEPLFTHPSRVAVQALALSEAGEAWVGFEGLYDNQRGSLFRRTP